MRVEIRVSSVRWSYGLDLTSAVETNVFPVVFVTLIAIVRCISPVYPTDVTMTFPF